MEPDRSPTKKENILNLQEPLIQPQTNPNENIINNGDVSMSASNSFPRSNNKIKDICFNYLVLGVVGYENVDGIKTTPLSTLKHEIQYEPVRDYIYDLPGHTTTHLLFISVLNKTNSIFYSLIAISFYYLPSLLLILIVAQIDRALNQNNYYISNFPESDGCLYSTLGKFWYGACKISSVIVLGICQSTLALLFSNACLLFKWRSYCNLNVTLIAISFILFNICYTYHLELLIYVVMLSIAVICMLTKQPDSPRRTDRSISGITRSPNLSFLGLPALKALITLGLVTIVLSIYTWIESKEKSPPYFSSLISKHFRIGGFTFAGGNSIIPLYIASYGSGYSNFILPLLKSLAVVSFLPGPLLNIAAYINSIDENSGSTPGVSVLAGLIGLVTVMIPSLLLLLAVLPYPQKFKYNTYLRNFLIGLNLASIGFIFSAVYLAFQPVCLSNIYLKPEFSLLNVCISFALFYGTDHSAPFVFVVAGLIAVILSLL